MKKKNYILSFLLIHLSCQPAFSQIYSFEDGKLPNGWTINKGSIAISPDKYKLGEHSLRINWNAGATLTLPSPLGISDACKNRNGGLDTWIYNESPVNEPLIFSFKDKNGKEVCQFPFLLNFKGWRCIWATFRADMNMPSPSNIQTVELVFPKQAKKGTTYLDVLEFSPKVSWQNMSDAQYKVNRTDYSLIPDFVGYRNTPQQVDQLITAESKQVSAIATRLTNWYLGSGQPSDDKWIKLRESSEKAFIQKGMNAAKKIRIAYNKDKSPVGEPLFPMGAPATIDGLQAKKFRTVNETVLLPLALDFHKNKNTQSLEKALYIYDWFNDQGWADGSGMGTLCFEKLRSSGYFHSFFLLKDKLTPQQLDRELKTFNWLTMFGTCYQTPEHAGEVADNLRALAIPKLIYALSLPNKQEQQVALTAFKHYMDNALGIAPGFFGTFKADFSGYHHRGPYHSAYYPHALYAGALIAYLLHDTPYALAPATMHNLKQGLLTFRFSCAGLNVPAGTVGRFPKGQQILETLLPAFAYLSLSSNEPDKELTAAFKRILTLNENQQAITDYISNVNSNLAYTSTVGEAELISRLASTPISPEASVTGTLFMPYSGILIAKDEQLHFNIKGFSRYIWDFESSATENLKGRYLAYGQIESFDFKNKRQSFNPQEAKFDWNYIPGTTTKVLPDEKLQDKGGSNSGHRNFSDETFLTGVHASANTAMFSFRMHDITYDQSFRANKSVFIFDDILLCLGSDIQNKDQQHPTVTTLFQSFEGKISEENTAEGCILTEPSLTYVIKKGEVKVDRDNAYTRAFINHGTAPEAEQYQYYMLKQNDQKLARQLLSGDSPIEVIAQNNDAHIVQHKTKGVTCGALFNTQKKHSGQLVSYVNIPLSYVAEKQGKDSFKLSVCEPDMRRISRAHMGLLTEEDVVQQEKPFDTQITINGLYNVECPQKTVKVTYNKDKNETSIIISTIRGENYTLLIHQATI